MGRGRYRLNPPIAYLAAQALFHIPRADCSSEPLHRLRRSGDQGLAFFYGLTYFGGARRECIDMAVGDSDLTELGMTPRQVLAANRCLRLSTPGRVLLAHLPEALRRQTLSRPLPAAEAGPGVYRDDERLLASLTDIRERGYAIGREECAPGLNSYASPVSWEGVVVGAVALLTPAHPTPAAEGRFLAAVLTAGAEIGSRLGQWSSGHPDRYLAAAPAGAPEACFSDDLGRSARKTTPRTAQ